MTNAQYQGILAALSAMPGAVVAYAGASLPSGYLPCDGAAVSRTTFSALFAAIGATWGAGNGTTTFNVPDLRGRAIIGVGTGAGLTARALADLVGAEKHNITLTELPVHTHTIPTDSVGISINPGATSLQGSSDSANTTVDSGAVGGTDQLSLMMPCAACNWIIKT